MSTSTQHQRDEVSTLALISEGFTKPAGRASSMATR
jgi:hypothetical protein